jgi:hypothetical protein
MSSDSRNAVTTEQQEPCRARRRSAAVNFVAQPRARMEHEQVELTPKVVAE